MLELSNPATNIFHFRESAKKKKVMYKLEKHISEAIKIKKREIISGKVKLTKIVSRDRLPKIASVLVEQKSFIERELPPLRTYASEQNLLGKVGDMMK